MRRSRMVFSLGISFALAVAVQVAVGVPAAFAGTLSPTTLTIPGYLDGSAVTLTATTPNNPAITTTSTCSAGTPCTWSATNLPTGLAITADSTNNGQTAHITGTPSQGVRTVTNATVTQSGGSGVSGPTTVTVSVIETLTSAGSFGGRLQYPAGMAMDYSAFNVYVSSMDSNAVNVINASVNPPVAFTSTNPMNFGSVTLNQPVDLWLFTGTTGSGVYVNNFGGGNGAVITPTATTGSPGTSPAQQSLGTCANPAGIGQDPSAANSTNVFVSCAGSGTVVRLNQNRTIAATIPLTAAASASGCSRQPVPSGVVQSNQSGFVTVVDSRCNLAYVVGGSSNTVSTTNPQLSLVSGTCTAPYAANVTFSNNGGQFDYVALPGCNQVVQINAGSSTSLSITGRLDTSASGCIRPYAVASTSATTGSVGAVACAGNRNFTSPGVLVLNLGSGSNFGANFFVPLPNGLVPNAIACRNTFGTVTTILCFVTTSFGNSVVVVDPPVSRTKHRLMSVGDVDAANLAATRAAVDELHPLVP